MSTLQIKKLESGAFEHVDSIDGNFFLGRFSFKKEFNKAFLVEAYGAKRREYTILDISVFDYLGSVETFTNFTDLINRLTDLGYTGIETNGMLPSASSYISTDVDNALGLGADNKLFVPEASGGVQSVVAGTNVTVDNTDPLNPIVSASGGGGDEFLLYDKFWKAAGFNINEWRSAGPTNASFGNDAFGNYGSATTPTDLKLYATWDTIPSGYIIDTIDLIVLYKGSGGASSIQVYLETGEVNYSDVTDSPSTTTVIVNETVSIPAGAFLLKFIYPLTVASNSLPTLNKKIVFKSIRELTLANPTYIFGFQYKFKKV